MKVKNKIKWIKAKGQPCLDNQGNCVRVIGFIQDITEIQNTLDALKKRKKQYHQLIKTMNDGAMILDRDGCITYVNDKYCEIIGRSSRDLIGHKHLEFMTESEQHIFIERFKFKSKEIADRYETVYISKKGNEICVLVSANPLYDDNKEYSGSFAVIKDITKQKEMEKQLIQYGAHLEEIVGQRTSELSTVNESLKKEIAERKLIENELRRSSIYLDTMGDALIVLDMVGKVVRVNKAALDLFGYSIPEIHRLTIDDLFMVKNHHNSYRSVGQGNEREKYTSNEIIGKMRNGAQKHLLRTDALVRDDTGNTTNVICVCRDISEFKRMQKLQNQQLSQLAHLARVMTAGVLSSSIAHELNQPLCAIATVSEGCRKIISSDAVKMELLIEGIEKIITQTRRAGQIIHRMRQFVSKQSSNKSLINLNDLIIESLNIMENLIHHGGICVHYKNRSKSQMVSIDRIQIQQVLVNLFQNAIDAMENKKNVQRILTITTSTDKEGFVEIVVKDNGEGFTEYCKEKMYEPFVTTKPKGIGIGLSICQNILESHGGYMDIESKYGVGTSVMINLPINNDNSPPSVEIHDGSFQ